MSEEQNIKIWPRKQFINFSVANLKKIVQFEKVDHPDVTLIASFFFYFQYRLLLLHLGNLI